MSIVQTKGNHKIDSTVATTALPPGLTCLNCKDCFKDCYARKSYRQYPNVRKSWDSNYALARECPEQFKTLVVLELKASKKKYCRIHVSGDFFSVEYVKTWIAIARECPEIRFWTYTKHFGLSAEMDAALHELDSLPNVNIVDSMPMGRVNFGSEEYINSLAEELQKNGQKCFVCACGTVDEVKCGGGCHACGEYKYVLFREH